MRPLTDREWGERIHALRVELRSVLARLRGELARMEQQANERKAGR